MRQTRCVGRLFYEVRFYSVINLIRMDARLFRTPVFMVTWMLLNF